mgnify:CR=1 FL=1
MLTCSKRHAFVDLFERCRHGSPKVLARPPQPQTQEQQRRAEKAERALARLGRINPLALEEHAAATERLRYLTGQVGAYLDHLDLARHRAKKVKELSKGMQQKAQIIAAVAPLRNQACQAAGACAPGRSSMRC